MAVKGLTLLSEDKSKRFCNHCQEWFPLDKEHWSIWKRTNRPAMQYDCRIRKAATKESLRGHVKTRYSQLKSTAKERNHFLELTLEDYIKLVDNKECNYCGDKLGGVGYNIDRIDSNQGYLKSNVVPCCKLCNQAKMNLTLDQFYMLIQKIANRIEREV